MGMHELRKKPVRELSKNFWKKLGIEWKETEGETENELDRNCTVNGIEFIKETGGIKWGWKDKTPRKLEVIG